MAHLLCFDACFVTFTSRPIGYRPADCRLLTSLPYS